MNYEQFFRCATGFSPYQWQGWLAENGFPDVLPVPTGLGKTEGVALAWAWRRLVLRHDSEPRHLVYCLPMRTLVCQTVKRLRSCLVNLQPIVGEVRVYELMGGAIEKEWAERPEEPWVLVGTQDQLLSRALNRGYCMSRFEWPIHFGLLNNDCRWIIDEVQLMGPGLWTTAQLDWMRRKRFGTLFGCPTTWMSATLGGSFLETTDRKHDGLSSVSVLPPSLIQNDSNPEIKRRLAAHRTLDKWTASASGTNEKAKQSAQADKDRFYQELAKEVVTKHVDGTLSLVICNTVETARRIFEALPDNGAPKVLLTSRFRRVDREQHEQRLIAFEAKRQATEKERQAQNRTSDYGKPIPNDSGLICVSTQVVEAGLDVSAHHLWSEVAPWPSIVQRLGRLNRDGRDQDARAWLWEPPSQVKNDEDQTSPYEKADVDLGRDLLESLLPLSESRSFVDALQELERTKQEKLKQALQPKPEPMPRAMDVHGLFSTERDVHGGFTDVSAFVRGTDPDADLTVVWRDWPGGQKKAPPSGDDLTGPPIDAEEEGCPVPFYRLRDALKECKARAWLWNEDDGTWEEIRPDDLRPGMVVMLHREVGGYSSERGWTGDAADRLPHVPLAGRGRALRDDERTEAGYWASVADHLQDARKEAEKLCDALGVTGVYRTAVVEAAALHDLGKAHPTWQKALPSESAIKTGSDIKTGPWAKCPRVLAVEVLADTEDRPIRRLVEKLCDDALPLRDVPTRRGDRDVRRLRWAVERKLTPVEIEQLRQRPGIVWAGHEAFRPALRHEAASALAMWHHYRNGKAPYPALAVYLAAAHHGKVRTVFRSLTDRGDDAFGVPRTPPSLDFRGVPWPLDFSVVKDGAEGTWKNGGFIFVGPGWTGLVADLLGPWRDKNEDPSEAEAVPKTEPRHLGPFVLAYLEALVRIADWRASARPSRCTKPSEVQP